METVFSEDGCVFRPAGVCCPDGPSSECSHCGWHPRIEEARKEQAREKLRRRWKLAAAGTPSVTARADTCRATSLGEGGKRGGGGDV